jgi:hypothetical protein
MGRQALRLVFTIAFCFGLSILAHHYAIAGPGEVEKVEKSKAESALAKERVKALQEMLDKENDLAKAVEIKRELGPAKEYLRREEHREKMEKVEKAKAEWTLARDSVRALLDKLEKEYDQAKAAAIERELGPAKEFARSRMGDLRETEQRAYGLCSAKKGAACPRYSWKPMSRIESENWRP